jgi:hypothetical protein
MRFLTVRNLDSLPSIEIPDILIACGPLQIPKSELTEIFCRHPVFNNFLTIKWQVSIYINLGKIITKKGKENQT